MYVINRSIETSQRLPCDICAHLAGQEGGGGGGGAAAAMTKSRDTVEFSLKNTFLLCVCFLMVVVVTVLMVLVVVVMIVLVAVVMIVLVVVVDGIDIGCGSVGDCVLFPFISYVFKKSFYFKQCCNMAIDKKNQLENVLYRLPPRSTLSKCGKAMRFFTCANYS